MIPSDEVKYSAPAPPPPPQDGGEQVLPPRDREASVKNAGLGAFDVGHLNARIGAGREGGAEVLERVRLLLEALVKEKEQEKEGEDEEMVDG